MMWHSSTRLRTPSEPEPSDIRDLLAEWRSEPEARTAGEACMPREPLDPSASLRAGFGRRAMPSHTRTGRPPLREVSTPEEPTPALSGGASRRRGPQSKRACRGSPSILRLRSGQASAADPCLLTQRREAASAQGGVCSSHRRPKGQDRRCAVEERHRPDYRRPARQHLARPADGVEIGQHGVRAR